MFVNRLIAKFFMPLAERALMADESRINRFVYGFMVGLPWKTRSVGNPRTPYIPGNFLLASQSIAPTFTLYFCKSFAASSYLGFKALQWPHQGA